MDELRINFNQRSHAQGVINSVEAVEVDSLGRAGWREVVTFQHLGRVNIPEPDVLDGYMFAFLLHAMSRNCRLVVEGPLSAQGLRNATCFAEAWECWRPDRYRKVEIVAERIEEEKSQAIASPTSAIAAFSGGVDATFTAIRHAGGNLGTSSYPLTELVMVHGFDVSIHRRSDFDALVRRTLPLCNQLEVDLSTVATNIREVHDVGWEHSFGTRIACVLHQFAFQHRYGLVASGSPYSHPQMSWGSTPQTDHLLSSDAFSIIHDAAGYSRTAKVEEIAKNDIASATIKVCWQGVRDQSKNCGECEKCVRTRLNFIAAGVNDPPCFDSPFEIRMIDQIAIANSASLFELDSIRETMVKQPANSAVAERLTGRLESLRKVVSTPKLVGAPREISFRIERHSEAICQFLRKVTPLYLLNEIPGNVGDQLIWEGTRRLFAASGIDYATITLDEVIKSGTSSRNGSLVVPGSGALTTNFHEWLPMTIIKSSSLFDRVVILPSEFEPSVPIVEEALKLANVFAYARDSFSYRKIKKYGRATLAPDLALWASDFIPSSTSGSAEHPEGRVLLALRTDAASRLSALGFQLSNTNNDVSATSPTLSEFLETIEYADSVVTDRLHVAVATILLGKTLHYVDPLDDKISRYLAYTFRGHISEVFNQQSDQWLLNHGMVSHLGEQP